MKKILVVEEMEGVRDLVCICLKNLGFEAITPAISLSDIGQELCKHREDIVCVVSDGRINSEFDGVDVVKLVRGVDIRIPILALTADGLIAVDMMRVGAAAFIIKPFNVDEFCSVIKSLMDMK